MESQESEHASVLDESPYSKAMFEAEQTVREYLRSIGELDDFESEYDYLCNTCGRNLPCRHCAE